MPHFPGSEQWMIGAGYELLVRSSIGGPNLNELSAPIHNSRPDPNGTYLRTSTRLYGESLMPEGRVEFAKIPVGSNSFDHWELAEYPRSNIPGRISPVE